MIIGQNALDKGGKNILHQYLFGNEIIQNGASKMFNFNNYPQKSRIYR